MEDFEQGNSQRKAVRQLNAEVARKIAAGEVIDRPNAIVRELMDNAVDSGASEISVEITGGGIDKIRVVDNGCGMTKEDLQNCARPHATSKISSEMDLLRLTTLGFRGEALSSMAAVSRLEIISGGFKMNASVTEDHVITPSPSAKGTIVQTSALFENFPARRQFLKRPSSEGIMCRSTFEEKVLPRPDIGFSLTMEGEKKLSLPKNQSLTQRFIQTMEFFETEDFFHEISSQAKDNSWSFKLIIGNPSVSRSNRKNIFIYVNGRKINEYSLVQAIEYGGTGYFPNGTHPVACLFVQMDPSLVDFNIHPAKREARFKDINSLHHQVSTETRNFFKQHSLQTMVMMADQEDPTEDDLGLDFSSLSQTNPMEEKPKDNLDDFPSTKHVDIKYQESKIPSHSYSTNKSDRRSTFFRQTAGVFSSNQKSYSSTMSEYADRVANLVASAEDGYGTDDLIQNAAVEGRTTKPNYYEKETDNPQENFHFVGSTMGTFLVAEKNDVLYIIDQHAAHERYLYNKIMESAGEKQELLVPYTVNTDSVADDNYLEEILDDLDKAGFSGKNCGDGRWEFTTVPARWKGSEEDLAKDLLDRRVAPHKMINTVAASTACRMAVMDGHMLDEKTASWIAQEALKLPDPHCPHGRPVFTVITKRQLFEIMKRI